MTLFDDLLKQLIPPDHGERLVVTPSFNRHPKNAILNFHLRVVDSAAEVPPRSRSHAEHFYECSSDRYVCIKWDADRECWYAMFPPTKNLLDLNDYHYTNWSLDPVPLPSWIHDHVHR